MQDELSREQTGLAGVWSVRSRLEAALATCWQAAIVHPALPNVPDLQGQIALRRVDAPMGVVYSSAIAPRLAANLGIPTEDLAIRLAERWPASTADKADWADSPLRVAQKHLVQVHLGDRLLAAWLQQFTRPAESQSPDLFPEPEPDLAIWKSALLTHVQPSPGQLQDRLLQDRLPQDRLPQDKLPQDRLPQDRLPQDKRFQDQWFEMQAAHARCCNLLALAERVGLVRFELPGAIEGELVWPMPMPWLTAEGTLRTQAPAEQRLIGHLLDSVDALGSIQHGSAIALAQSLSRCVYDFDASCRIFGDVAVHQLELAQARLGLVRAAQQTLRWLLEGPLQVAAPPSL
ncbi:hypothetical protein HNI00_01955 [Thermoleptolyngbya oregonensis NK1-22]|uniref:DALR anticodon binding domain-containing protein n=1 Tax=Thermoleptolyngbya oregonensis NK1-22 TaxID=2547457 RepID=A0AA96Y8M3_9CYAN|nr:hypothetical protein [Thermoleptolyngbya oregonensis]WOB42065.1 hypothetical protein HNI00_01955 [Thermoleptolyngbya oregonensis NK1-22]